MGEIKKSGLIPKNDSLIYKENFRLSDDSVAKYISLDGYKKFYNPGIGLDLSSPNGSIASNKLYQVDQVESETVSKSLVPISGNHYNTGGSVTGTKYWITLDNQNPIIDQISGVKFNALEITSSQQGRILNVQESGNYTIKYSGNMKLSMTSLKSFKAFMEFYLNVNGTLIPLFPMSTKDYSDTLGFVGPNTQLTILGDTGGLLSGNQLTENGYDFDSVLDNLLFNYSGSFYIPVGGYVELYGLVNYGGTKNGNFTMELYNYQLSISLETDSTVSSIYTNPLNIATMKNKSINYYGLSRDTLKLIGNKLTS